MQNLSTWIHAKFLITKNIFDRFDGITSSKGTKFVNDPYNMGKLFKIDFLLVKPFFMKNPIQI